MSNGLLNVSGLTTPKVTTEEIILKGKPISNALANDICGWMMPNYATRTEIPLETATVIPYHSFATIEVRANHNTNTTDYEIRVNDMNIVTLSSVGWNSDSLSFFIKKGDIIEIKNRNVGSSTTPIVRAYFYRLSGAAVEETTE